MTMIDIKEKDSYYSRYSLLNFTHGKPDKQLLVITHYQMLGFLRNIITLPSLLLPSSFWSLRLIMNPHLPPSYSYHQLTVSSPSPNIPQIISTNSSLLQILEDSLPSFLQTSHATLPYGKYLPYLPVRQSSFPLACPCLVLAFDHHHASFCCSKLKIIILLNKSC